MSHFQTPDDFSLRIKFLVSTVLLRGSPHYCLYFWLAHAFRDTTAGSDRIRSRTDGWELKGPTVALWQAWELCSLSVASFKPNCSLLSLLSDATWKLPLHNSARRNRNNLTVGNTCGLWGHSLGIITLFLFTLLITMHEGFLFFFCFLFRNSQQDWVN